MKGAAAILVYSATLILAVVGLIEAAIIVAFYNGFSPALAVGAVALAVAAVYAAFKLSGGSQ